MTAKVRWRDICLEDIGMISGFLAATKSSITTDKAEIVASFVIISRERQVGLVERLDILHYLHSRFERLASKGSYSTKCHRLPELA